MRAPKITIAPEPLETPLDELLNTPEKRAEFVELFSDRLWESCVIDKRNIYTKETFVNATSSGLDRSRTEKGLVHHLRWSLQSYGLEDAEIATTAHAILLELAGKAEVIDVPEDERTILEPRDEAFVASVVLQYERGLLDASSVNDENVAPKYNKDDEARELPF